MKQDEFKQLLKQSVDHLEDRVDYKMKIMGRIEEEALKPKKFFIRKYLIVVAIIICFSTTIYAGVLTLQIVELKNDQDEVIGRVEVVETEENFHLDSHTSGEELIRFADDLSVNDEWEGKSFVVIDAEGKYPMNMDLRPKHQYKRMYSEVLLLDDVVILPEAFGDYHFDGLSISYEAEFPEEDEILGLIQANADERFIIAEVASGLADHMSYMYLNEVEGLFISVNIAISDENESLTFFTSTLENYEVVKVDDIEVFLSQSDYVGIRYDPNRTIKILGENYFKTNWYEPNQDIKVSVRPNLMYGQEGVVEEVDGEYVSVEVFPEDMKEQLIEFTQWVHSKINEVNRDQ